MQNGCNAQTDISLVSYAYGLECLEMCTCYLVHSETTQFILHNTVHYGMLGT